MIAGVPVLVRPNWEKLVPTDDPEQDTPAAADLPPAAQQWLATSIDPNTPQWAASQLVFRGALKLADWHEYIARQVVNVDQGFIWAAESAKGVPMRLTEECIDGTGALKIRLAGLVPIGWRNLEKISLGAAGRFALESLWVPTGWDRWQFTPGRDDREFVVTVPVGEHRFQVTATVDDQGRLQTAWMNRWGYPELRGQVQEAPFGVRVQSWSRWNGVLIPDELTASWWFDSAGESEFFRAKIDMATFA